MGLQALQPIEDFEHDADDEPVMKVLHYERP